MNDYNSVRIDATPCSEDITDLAAAFLADAGFESFEPDADGLTAYIRATPDAAAIAGEALADFPIPTDFTITSELIEGEDWNAEWEKNYFKPIVIGDKVCVHSTFHKDVPEAEYDIVIDPKMAFGTGHHDTTSQMMRLILELPLEGKRVTDMGTGTGILAILAKMRGAGEVSGIEIDEPAYLNAIEHAALNKVDLKLIHGDASGLDGLEPADYLFANINRNIILADIDRYSSAVKKGGAMLLSGFYEEDVDMIAEACAKYGFSERKRLVSPAKWTAIMMVN
ncbi:MAG: 50S ribosomal protein L11 methyltransferase [Bacteroides sp.]|nr:50S ribosomal protein L11 methyltransferase [Bacteroides sp.]